MNRKELKSLVLQQVHTVSSHPDMVSVLDKTFDELYAMGANNFNRWAMLLSQCSHESLNFTVFEENLRYSQKALLAVFGKYFNAATAKKYAYRAEDIGNIVYANRMGNNDTNGYANRGRGAIMITGANNYRSYGYANKQERLLKLEVGLIVAGRFFTRNNLWRYSDNLNIRSVTRVINGGYNGLRDRTDRLRAFCAKPVVKAAGILKMGSRGNRVVELQKLLGFKGYRDPNDHDGIFGPATEEDVREFQLDYGLTVDGKVGSITYEKLMNVQ